VKTSLNYEALNAFRIHAEEKYRACKQIAEILGASEIDHESSACAAGIRRGVHYESKMKTAEANTHLRLLTGVLIKSPVVQADNPMPGTEPDEDTMKSGSTCKVRIAHTCVKYEA